jgi:hypothetical protein
MDFGIAGARRYTGGSRSLRDKDKGAMMNPYIAMAILGGFCLLAVSPILISDWRNERRRRRK